MLMFSCGCFPICVDILHISPRSFGTHHASCARRRRILVGCHHVDAALSNNRFYKLDMQLFSRIRDIFMCLHHHGSYFITYCYFVTMKHILVIFGGGPSSDIMGTCYWMSCDCNICNYTEISLYYWSSVRPIYTMSIYKLTKMSPFCRFCICDIFVSHPPKKFFLGCDTATVSLLYITHLKRVIEMRGDEITFSLGLSKSWY